MNKIYAGWKINIPTKIDNVVIWINYLSQIGYCKTKYKNWKKVFVISEPRSISPRIYDYIKNNYNMFDLILTFDEEILKLNNSKKLLIGVTWIEIREYTKEYNISMICGKKNSCLGHKLRQYIYAKQQNINIPKKIFRSDETMENISENNILGAKKEPLFNSMFHICIENNKQTNYFTEKIMDCFISKTIPIYWGCPNIDEFFDTRGIIILNTNDVDEIIECINNLTENDYNIRKEYLEINKEKSMNYLDYGKRIANIVDEYFST